MSEKYVILKREWINTLHKFEQVQSQWNNMRSGLETKPVELTLGIWHIVVFWTLGPIKFRGLFLI